MNRTLYMIRRQNMRRSIVWILLCAVLLLAAACDVRNAAPATVLPEPSPVFTPTLIKDTALSTETAAAAATPTAVEPTTPPTHTATLPAVPFALCSPLEGITLAELDQPDLLKNPFQLPRPGMDDGHHGVDFAYWSRGERSSMLDLPVNSVLPGTVAAVLDNRIPYGYTVIIETPLDQLPQEWMDQIAVPTPAPTIPPAGALFCPPEPIDYTARPGRSLYLLYAHFSQPAPLSVGQTVACGENIGLVGTTGNSVNYHLHLETRVGPAGATFAQMAHYDNRAVESELRSYCTWRVSGLFQMFDPMEILSLQP
jgi:murein DD-endopeptidase MepM/ murein hydrolase activator NlpD